MQWHAPDWILSQRTILCICTCRKYVHVCLNTIWVQWKGFEGVLRLNIYICYVYMFLGIPSTEETMSSLLTAIQSSSQSQLSSQQYSECPVTEWNSGGNSTNSTASSNGQIGSVGCLHFSLTRDTILNSLISNVWELCHHFHSSSIVMFLFRVIFLYSSFL